jgi:hypothetical protein
MTDITGRLVVRIAAVAWAADAEFRAQYGDPVPSLPGDDGDADAHSVTVARVRAVLEGATPEEIHERWVRARWMLGWKYGPQPDSQEKIHPALVPYAQLPEGQRTRDRVFAAIVREMAGDSEARAAANTVRRAEQTGLERTREDA